METCALNWTIISLDADNSLKAGFMAPKSFLPRGITLTHSPQTRHATPLQQNTTAPVSNTTLRPGDHFGIAVMDAVLEGITMPLRYIPLRVSAFCGVAGFLMPLKSIGFGILNTEPLINAAAFFGSSCLGWAGVGCAWGLMRGLHDIWNTKKTPHADFFRDSK